MKIGNTEDLDVVMSMYNLLAYSKNYKKTTGSLLNYYRDEPSDPLSSNSDSCYILRQLLQEILIILMKKLQMMMLTKLIILNMMQIELVKMKLELLFS